MWELGINRDITKARHNFHKAMLYVRVINGGHLFVFAGFCGAMLYLRAAYAVAWCPSVCPGVCHARVFYRNE